MEEKTTWDAVAGPSNNRIESSQPDVPQSRVDLIVPSDSAPNTDLETMSTKDGAGEKDQYYLERAPVWRALVHLCVPMMLALSANVIYGIINAYFIGTLHDTAMLSAIALGLPVLSLAMAIGGVFGVGGGAYISRLLGEKDTGRIKHVSAFVLYGSLLLGVILTVICFIFLNPLVRVLGTDQQSFLPTQDYVSVLLLFLPVLIANFAVSQIVRAIGAARQAMNGMILSIGTNLLFDVLFILLLHLNVTGAALSIALSNMASLVYYILFLQMRDGPVKLAVKYFLVTKELLKEVFGIGLSELILSSFLIVTTLLVNNLAVQYGDYVIAAFGVSLRIVQLPEFICMGVLVGVMPLLGYSYGSKNSARLKAALQQSSLAIAGIIAIFSTIVYLFRSEVFSLFSSSHDVVSFGSYILTAMLISTLFNGFTGLIIAYFQTTNKPLQTTIMSFAQGSLFIPVILVAQALAGLSGIVWSMTITEAITCLIGIGLFTFSKKK